MPHDGSLLVQDGFDASFNADTGDGYSLVVRDEVGALVAAAAFHAGAQMDAEIADASCFKWEIKLCHTLGCTRFQFETDCLTFLMLGPMWLVPSLTLMILSKIVEHYPTVFLIVIYLMFLEPEIVLQLFYLD